MTDDQLNRLIVERDMLLKVIVDIAQPGYCTGEDAVAYSNWARQVLDELDYDLEGNEI